MTPRPPTGRGVHTVAVRRFRPEGPDGYAAVFPDGTLGPVRPSRAAAEADWRKARP